MSSPQSVVVVECLESLGFINRGGVDGKFGSGVKLEITDEVIKALQKAKEGGKHLIVEDTCHVKID